MDSLFNIFEREKKRVGDKFTVFYNQKKNWLQYSNNDGALTVVFDAENGSEQFYYRSKDAEKGTGIGKLIQQTIEHGHKARFAKESIDFCPQDFINLCADYQFNRKAIGVELGAEKTTTRTLMPLPPRRNRTLQEPQSSRRQEVDDQKRQGAQTSRNGGQQAATRTKSRCSYERD